jgi:hypothetical protein
MLINNITIGSDIEVFLKNKEGVPVSSEGIIPGEKYNPHVVEGFRTLSLDNVSSEFTINPVVSEDEFVKEIQYMLNHISDYVKDKDLEVDIYPCREFSAEELSTENAMTLGCDQDYNARTRSVNNKPEVDDIMFRSCGKNVCHLMK